MSEITPEQAQAEIDLHMAPGSAYLSPKTNPWEAQRLGERLVELRRIVQGTPGSVEGSMSPSATTPGEGAPGAPPVEPSPGIDVANLPPLPSGELWHGPTVEAFRQSVRELGGDDGEVKDWLAYFAKSLPTDAPDPDAGEKELRDGWGGDFDRKMEAARLAYSRFPYSIRHHLAEQGFEDDPRVIRRLAALGQPLLEARERINAIHAGKIKASPEELRRLFVVLAGTRPVLTI